jgi:hypothetical protein
MAKRKDRHYNGQKKGQTLQWPKERTDITMAKRKDRHYNGQKKGQTIQWPKEKGQKDKLLSSKYCIENFISSNMNPTKNRG